MQTLDLRTLKKAVFGEYAAIRRVTRMEALGEKLFPLGRQRTPQAYRG
jgi:hypothetical protein